MNLNSPYTKDTNALIYLAGKGKHQQRGANKNTNGLLKQYLLKGLSFAIIINTDIQHAVLNLNNRS